MIEPHDFLCSADACLAEHTNNPNEAHIRSTISRAYYAAFHHAKKQAEQFGIHVTPPAEHQTLIAELQNHKDTSLRTAGNRLFQLRDKRTKADYQLNSTLTLKEAKLALVAARTLMANFVA